jgi:predicted transposase YbfD/YdcC
MPNTVAYVLHWQHDVSFGEDAARNHARTTAHRTLLSSAAARLMSHASIRATDL